MLTKEDTKRVMLARVREWDTGIGGQNYFDKAELNPRYASHPSPAQLADKLIARSPEAGLDFG
jgi:hypothetical protein